MGKSGSRHSSVEQFAATGEIRQIYACDLRLPPDAALVRIERGQAPELRADSRAGYLACPIPGCASPAYSTRGGSRRDHFFHLAIPTGGHGSESWFHYVGKRVIAGWLTERYPEARVVVDAEKVESGQLPDVLATFPDGRRFAFEIQYAALSMEEWAVRSLRYFDQEIVDVWLFGHRRPHFRQERLWPELIALPPLQAAMEQAGRRVHWINPDDQTVASLRQISDDLWRDMFMESCEDQIGPRRRSVAVEPLAGCFINGSEFTTSLDRREAELLATATAERQRRRDREAAAEADRERKRAWRRGREVEEERAYEKTTRPWVLRDLAGAIRAIEVRLPGDPSLWMYPFQWHAVFFRDLVQGHVGQMFSYRDACGPFMNHGRPPILYHAITGFLFHLRHEGYVDFESTDYWIEGDIRVLADADHPPSRWPW